MSKDEQPRLFAPLLALEEIDPFLEPLRRAGRRIVFTNGCFDLIHPGHVGYLIDARRLGDCLLVGLNSDASVERLKGPGRPLTPQEGRVEVLAALRCVDALVVFEEDTPIELIRKIQPHVLAKGGDYAPGEVVGADDLKLWGGELRILPYREGYSTSEMIRRLVQASRHNPK